MPSYCFSPFHDNIYLHWNSRRVPGESGQLNPEHHKFQDSIYHWATQPALLQCLDFSKLGIWFTISLWVEGLILLLGPQGLLLPPYSHLGFWVGAYSLSAVGWDCVSSFQTVSLSGSVMSSVFSALLPLIFRDLRGTRLKNFIPKGIFTLHLVHNWRR